MASPIADLRSAGFGDREIEDWAAEKRSTLSDAGFADNEIDAYFAGGRVVSDKIPDALVKRVADKSLLADIGDFAKSGWDTIIKNEPDREVGEAVQQYAITHGMSPKMAKQQRATIEGRMQRGNVEFLMGPMELIASPVLGAYRHYVSRPLEETIGVPKEITEGVSMLAVAVAGIGRSMLRTPSGEPIGRLPESQDVVDAAKAVDGQAHPLVQDKLLKLYDERGLIPAEVAHAAETDPIVAQKLLSSEPADLPFSPNKIEYSLADVIDSGYQFHGYEPTFPEKVEKAIQAARDIGLDARQTETYFQNIPARGRPKSVDNIPPQQTSETSELPKLFGDFEIKPMEAPKEQLAPREGSIESAKEEVSEKISVGDRETRRLTWRKLYTEAIDDLHPIKKVSDTAYQLARLTRGQFGKAEHFLEHGSFDFDTYATNGKPLRAIVEPIRDDLSGFREYLASKRAVEIEESGRKSGIDFLAARQVVTEGKKKFGRAAEEIVGYQNNLIKYLRDSGVLSDRAFEAMTEANRNYVPFYRVFFPEKGQPATKGFGPGNPIKALKGSERGIIDPLESIIKNTYAYISIAERNAVGIKIVDALKDQGFKASSKAPKFEGAEADLVDYLKQNGVHDAEALIDFVKASAADDGTVISAWRDGKRVSVETNDADLVTAFRAMDQQSIGLITKIFAIPAKTLRAGATLTPDFAARNLIRDFQTALVNSKGLFTPIDTAKGLMSVVRKDADFQNWLKSGGANATFVALDRRYMQESLQQLTNDTGLGTRAWNVATNPLAPLRMMSEMMENATRLGEFKKATGGSLAKEALQNAGYASREVTLDFAKIGARMRAYNMVTAFANAQIQGMDRIGRAFKDRPINTTAKIAGGITAPSVLLWWANHGDPRYEELPDWQKDLFWIILTDKWEPIAQADAADKPQHLVRERAGQMEFNNGHIWRIPKPFELGVIFGSGVERALSATIGQRKDAFDEFSKSVMQTLSPNYIPTAVQPLFEQWANRSTFTDRTLVPAYAEKQLPEYQYTPYTTELSKALGQVVSAFPGMRQAASEEGAVMGPAARALTTPILIENYIRSWTGGLGTYVLQASDLALRKAGVLPDPVLPTPTLADIPFIKAFAVRYPSASTESIQRFFDDYKTNKKFFDTWMAKAKEGDPAAMQRIQEAGGPRMFVQLDSIKEVLTEHTKLVRDIYKNPDMASEEKRQLIDGLYYNMIQIGQAGRQIMNQAGAAQ